MLSINRIFYQTLHDIHKEKLKMTIKSLVAEQRISIKFNSVP